MSNQYCLKDRCTCLLFYNSGGEEISISTTYAGKRDAATSQKAYADMPNFDHSALTNVLLIYGIYPTLAHKMDKAMTNY